MSLLGPDGRPVKTQLPPEQILRILAGQKGRLDQLDVRIIHLGLFTEYLYEQTQTNLDKVAEKLQELNVEVDLSISMEDFNKYASTRFEEIQKEAASQLEQEAQAMAGTAPTEGINLSEEG